MASIEIPSGIKVLGATTIDDLGKFDAIDEPTAVALALASIPSALRYIGRSALCNGVLYTFVNNISDAYFIPYSISSLKVADEHFNSLVVSGSIGSTGATVTFTNYLNQIPMVFINGLKVEVGFDIVPSNNLCFFSPNGTSVREQLVEFVSGDLLYWNPNFANSFNLAITDEINLVYNKI